MRHPFGLTVIIAYMMLIGVITTYFAI